MLGLGKGNKVECIGRKEREIQSPMQCQYLNLIKRLKKKKREKIRRSKLWDRRKIRKCVFLY